MNSPKIERWFQNYRKRRDRSELIEASLLKGSLTSYYFFRLRYFLIRTLIGAIIFSIELKILIEGFGKDFFAQSLGARTLLVLVMAFWWAGLELLRTRIREYKNEGKSFLIPKVILVWLKYSLNLSFKVLITLTLSLILLSLFAPNLTFNAFGFYILTLIIRLSVDIPLRAYHSSVYATTRIYRPIYWILASEVISFILFLSLFPILGAWSVGISSLVSLGLGSSVSYYYISQSFQYLGYQSKIKYLKLKRSDQRILPKFLEIAKRAIPLTLLRLDAILIILLLVTTNFERNPQSYQQLIIIALCIPLLYAAQEWSMLLYFDYKKFELDLFKKLRQKFSTAIKYLVFILAVCLWLLLPLLGWICGLGWVAPSLAILALLASSSYLGQQSIRVFSLGSNKQLLFFGISLLVALLTILTLSGSLSLDTRVFLASIILTLHALAMDIGCKDLTNNSKHLLCPPTTWLRKLKQALNPWAAIIVLESKEDQNNEKFLIREVAQTLQKVFSKEKQTLSITSFSHNKIVILGENKTDPKKLHDILFQSLTSLIPNQLKNLVVLPCETQELEELEELKELEGLENSNNKSNLWQNTTLLINIAAAERRLQTCLQISKPKVSEPNELVTFDFYKKNPCIPKQECPEILSGGIKYFYYLDTKRNKQGRNWLVACEEKNGTIVSLHALPKRSNKRWLKQFTNKCLWQAWND